MKRLEAQISFGAIIGHVLIWAVLVVVTCGLAAFFYPYAFGRVLLNNAYVLDGSGRRVAQLRCDADVGDEVLNILLWMVISFLTFGLGAFFYLFKAFSVVLNNTIIVPLE